jgi:hypothetical protein
MTPAMRRALLRDLPRDPEASSTPDSELTGAKRRHERVYASLIDCPMCEEALEEATEGSIFQSVRCGSCGHLLGFDEVMALRAAEHAHASRYV